MEDFFNITPNHLLKQYIMHIRYHQPKALNEDSLSKKIYTLDETPFL